MSETCGEALGFESGAIKDAQFTASSVWMGLNTFGPQRARLNNQQWPQGWSADLSDKHPWIKISLQSDYVITGIATQGYGNSVFDEWVESYYLVWLDVKAGEVFYHEDGKLMVGKTLISSISSLSFIFTSHIPPLFERCRSCARFFYFPLRPNPVYLRDRLKCVVDAAAVINV